MTQIYDNLAGDYARHRPEYPEALLEALWAHYEAGRRAGWPRPELVVDVGAGTGIATRLLRRTLGPEVRIIALEPSAGMREQAAAGTPSGLAIEFRDGSAEQLPFESGAATLINVAQAVHWFDRTRFYAEARRVLAPGGTLAILQNNRDWRASPFLDAYETFLETYGEDYSRHYRAFDIEAELGSVEGLEAVTLVVANWEQPMTVEQFAGMARSSSRVQAAMRRNGEQRTIAALLDLLDQYAQSDGTVAVQYRSELYLARRAAS